MHIELLLEEASSEAFFRGFFKKILPGVDPNFIVFQGKKDLLKNLPSRLKGYRRWIQPDWKIVVLVDEDREDCCHLKRRLEEAARDAGFTTKSTSSGASFVVLNRIAVEELEAWFFGDVSALVKAFPGVSPNLGKKTAYRNPDAIRGGTWEKLQTILQHAGYYRCGIAKCDVAKKMGEHMVPERNTSESFKQFVSGLHALTGM